MAIRTESPGCVRIESALKSLTQWSIDKDCQYRSFMNSLHPHVLQLGQFLNSFSKIKNNSPNLLWKPIESDKLNTLSSDQVDESNYQPEHRRSVTANQHSHQLKRQTSLLEPSVSRSQNLNVRRSSQEEISAKEPGACNVM